MPEVDIEQARRDWENEQVPYDDAMIAGFEQDSAADAPPVDVPPTVPASAASSVVAPAASGAQGAPHYAAPWEEASRAAASVEPIPEGEVASVLGDIFGAGVKLSPVDSLQQG